MFGIASNKNCFIKSIEMRKKLSNDLKKAISQMPSSEKDKLLFRLVSKDTSLTERLIFQLLEWVVLVIIQMLLNLC